MAASYPGDPARTEKSSLSARLDGWKDIASYLSKAERTVKRWESDRGLPIHRVPGSPKASVYAYPWELDQWLMSHALGSETEESVLGADAGNTTEATDTDSQAPTPIQPALKTHPAAPSRLPRLRWAIAFLILVVVGLAFAATEFAATGVPLEDRIHALLAKRDSKVDSASSNVSDVERSLARDYYLRGRYQWNQRSPDSLNRALDLFTQAIVHDPGYAQAYAGLADTYDLLYEYAAMPEKDAFSRAIAAARKAVELDDSLAEAHRALAYAEMYGNWDFVDSEKEFRRAIELDPKDAQARRWFANAFAVSGRFQESLEQLDKAQELDPASNATLADKALLLADAGRTGEAIELLKEVERSSPDFRSPHAYLMRISLSRGDYPTFLSEGQKTAETMNDPVLNNIMTTVRAAYARGGRRGLLNTLYARQKEYYLEGRFDGTSLATTCVLMGRKQEALQLLEDAYSHHETEVWECLANPDLLSLRDEPRFKALAARINFPQYSANPVPRDLGVDTLHQPIAVPH